LTEHEVKAIRGLIAERRETHLQELKSSPRHREAQKQRDELEAQAEELLAKMDKAERLTVRRFVESEIAKAGIEMNAAYLGGLTDGVELLVGVLSRRNFDHII
jgi:hypothetical protein